MIILINEYEYHRIENTSQVKVTAVMARIIVKYNRFKKQTNEKIIGVLSQSTPTLSAYTLCNTYVKYVGFIYCVA